MIQSKRDLIFYKEADRIIAGKPQKSWQLSLKRLVVPDHLSHFLVLLRNLEYYKNCRRGIVYKFLEQYYAYRFRQLSVKLGFSIPPNVFGPGLYIPHYGTIVVNKNARVGANCVLHTGVCIGGNQKKAIGDNAYLSTGAMVSGAINLPDNTTICPYSIVNKTFEEGNVLLGGTPARFIKTRNAWFLEEPDFEERVSRIADAKQRIYASKLSQRSLQKPERFTGIFASIPAEGVFKQ